MGLVCRERSPGERAYLESSLGGFGGFISFSIVGVYIGSRPHPGVLIGLPNPGDSSLNSYSAHTEKEACGSSSLYIRHVPEEVRCPVPRRTAALADIQKRPATTDQEVHPLWTPPRCDSENMKYRFKSSLSILPSAHISHYDVMKVPERMLLSYPNICKMETLFLPENSESH